MPRKKNPEYYKYFETRVEGHGLTEEQAEYNYTEDYNYKLKWIKGTVSEAGEEQRFQHSDGSWTVYSFLKFTQTRYLEENENGN